VTGRQVIPLPCCCLAPVERFDLSLLPQCLFELVLAVSACHQVVHRDIKLENILLDATNNMKLIDFGLAAFYATGKKLRVHCGSPSYAAPEIVARKLYEGPPVDVWSLGVVLFAMMSGFLPFHSPTGNKQVG
jgi:5'-AMP-activated protein kinase catalytic alpha subunit